VYFDCVIESETEVVENALSDSKLACRTPVMSRISVMTCETRVIISVASIAEGMLHKYDIREQANFSECVVSLSSELKSGIDESVDDGTDDHIIMCVVKISARLYVDGSRSAAVTIEPC
jgi:hypothetical protein